MDLTNGAMGKCTEGRSAMVVLLLSRAKVERRKDNISNEGQYRRRSEITSMRRKNHCVGNSDDDLGDVVIHSQR